MSNPVFMSPEHVAAMNDILASNDEVRAACALLEKPETLAYELANGPDGETVWWSMTFADTVRFGLEPTEAALCFKGDWAQMVRASRGGRDGEEIDPGVEPIGDLAVLERVAGPFAVSRHVATIPVDFPEV